MSDEPEIALSVTTYQKPWHLRRALASIAGQRGVEGRMELVVTDDGSTDETAEIVEQFRRRVPVSRGVHHARAYDLPSRRGAATTAPGRRSLPICCSSTAIACCRPITSRFIGSAKAGPRHARRLPPRG